MDKQSVDRRLTAILSADAVGYTRLMARDEVATVRALKRCREHIRRQVAGNRGRVVDSRGDNILAEFPSVTDAVKCAVEIQRVLTERNTSRPAESRMEFRIGIHLGEVVLEGGEIYGDGVNIAARLEALARPGGVAISGAVRAQLANKLEFSFDDFGWRSLKNVPDPVRVFTVEAPEERRARRPVIRRIGYMQPAVAAAVLVAIGAALLWYSAGIDQEAGVRKIQSLAVLPLENYSGDPSQEYFVDGMTEALIGQLALQRLVRVISRTSVMQYKNVRRPLPEIAAELGVDAVIEGSVFRSGDRIRVTAQLIDARNDQHLWASSYEREASDILALQSEIANAIASQIQIELEPQTERRLKRLRTIDGMAHDKYLWGLYHLNRAGAGDLDLALDSFGKAIEIDPDYAEAFVGVAESYLALGQRTPLQLAASQTSLGAKQAAQRALELDDSLAGAHSALGLVQLLYDWEPGAASVSFRRALDLNSNHVSALAGHAAYLSSVGQHEQAISYSRRAAEVAPLDPAVRYGLALTLMRAGRDQEAIEQAERVLRIDPMFWDAYGWTGWFLRLRSGETEAALENFERWLLRARRSDPEARRVYAESGTDAYFRYWLTSEALTESLDPYLSAVLYARVGDADQAFAQLERSLESRTPALAFLRVDPALDPLRQDPRFAGLIERVAGT